MTSILIWVGIPLALVGTFLNWKKLSDLAGKVEEAERGARFNKSMIEEVERNAKSQLSLVRGFVAKVARGEKVRKEAILEGRLFQDLKSDECLRILEEHPDVPIIDVRTPGEYSSGHIPGAILIPVDDLPDLGEIPKDAETVIVHCASGGRSSAACQYLGEQGFLNLVNMVGGFNAWKGPRESGGGA